MNTTSEVIETNPFDHIIYEFLMYLQASVSQSTDQFVINLLVDSRKVHMRNLADFFCSRKKGKKYLHYTDYIQGRLPYEVNHELYNEIQRMASNSTCHLLKGRFSESFKRETASFEREVFPLFLAIIKDFIAMAKERVRPEYKLQWQNEKIQENVNYLEELISFIEGGNGEKEIIVMDSTPFKNKIWLSSPTMHGEELQFMQEAYETNWMSTVGANINEAERITCELIGCKEAVALSSGTAALHLAIKLAGEQLYGRPKASHGTLEGKKVFCTDMTFDATANPIAYEGGESVFIDSEYDSWNMDPEALKTAFALYPDVKLIVLAHLYGVPAKMKEIREIADAHGALIVEDAAESLGATYDGVQTGNFGDYSILSFNGNKIITGSSGGMLLCKDKESAEKARKWSTQSREAAPWYQHEELGYNYRMSNVIAGVVRGQYPHLGEHIAQKKDIYERYKAGLAGLPLQMNPVPDGCVPNYWLSCALIDRDAMCEQTRGDLEASFVSEYGKSCPTEILEAIAALNAEGRPIWKPMHMQPLYRENPFVTAGEVCVCEDIFERGFCLPSDNKMTMEQVDVICEVVRECFR